LLQYSHINIQKKARKWTKRITKVIRIQKIYERKIRKTVIKLVTVRKTITIHKKKIIREQNRYIRKCKRHERRHHRKIGKRHKLITIRYRKLIKIAIKKVKVHKKIVRKFKIVVKKCQKKLIVYNKIVAKVDRHFAQKLRDLSTRAEKRGKKNYCN